MGFMWFMISVWLPQHIWLASRLRLAMPERMPAIHQNERQRAQMNLWQKVELIPYWSRLARKMLINCPVFIQLSNFLGNPKHAKLHGPGIAGRVDSGPGAFLSSLIPPHLACLSVGDAWVQAMPGASADVELRLCALAWWLGSRGCLPLWRAAGAQPWDQCF